MKKILVIVLLAFVWNFSSTQNVIAPSDPSITTDTLKSGGLILGINSNGGGVVNYLSIPGIGNIFGPQSVKYGRSGQSAMRDGLHSGRYNPTQAGFNETLGTPCTIEKQTDKLLLPARPLALWYGDCEWDFTEWENIGADPSCYNDGGNSDVDQIDESNLEGKQNTEVKSEFDYYGKYHDYKGKGGIDIACIRHYFEYRYARNPGHCINQFRPGLSIYNDTKIHNDISNLAPGGVHGADPFDMSYYILSWHMRYDIENWNPKYRFVKNADGSWNANASLRDGAHVYETHQESNTPSVPRLVIISDSNDPEQGNALGFYMPESEFNRFETIGVDGSSNEIVYKDNRYSSIRIWDQPARIPTMGLLGFKVETNGILNPTRLEENHYEAYRYDLFIFLGSPNEIWEAALKIEQKASFWNFRSGLSGWNADDGIGLSVENDMLKANIIGGTTGIWSPDSLLIDADLQKFLVFRMRNKTPSTSFSFQFEKYGTDDVFTIPVTVSANDEDWKTYRVKVADFESWSDMIKRVGLQLNSSNGVVEVDYISLGADGIVDCNGDFQGYAYLDGCGDCVGGNTGEEPCEDCMGVVGGAAYLNGCGDCVGGTSEVQVAHEWDFYSLNEWSLNPRMNGYSNGGIAYLNVTGADPYMNYNGNVCINSETNKYLNVILKNNTNSNVATVYFQNDVTNAWKTFSFNVSQSDQELKNYWFDLSGNANWVGNIHKIRFDPPGDDGAFELDYLGVLESAIPVSVRAKSISGILKVIPNPASGEIQILGKNNARIEIVGVNGQICLKQELMGGFVNFDVSSWSKGIYLVRSFSEEEVQNVKLLVQ